MTGDEITIVALVGLVLVAVALTPRSSAPPADPFQIPYGGLLGGGQIPCSGRRGTCPVEVDPAAAAQIVSGLLR